jgi:Uma2 family endonuclease
MFEFEAEVQDGQIIIPAEYRSHFPNGTIVKVTVLRSNAEPVTKPNVLYDQMVNPVELPGWKMTRDEMHDR